MRVTPRSPAKDSLEREREWHNSISASTSWSSTIDTHDIAYVAEFNYVLDRYVPEHGGALLEWGAGISTRWLLAIAEKRHCSLFVTIDDSEEYLEKVVAFLPVTTVPFEAHVMDDVGETDDKSLSRAPHYSTLPFEFGRRFDLIYVDGRRRNECLLSALMLLTNCGVVVLHDYRRARYQLGCSLFDIVEDFYGFRIMRRPAHLADTADRIFTGLTRQFAGAHP